jgi:hypothetical protein
MKDFNLIHELRLSGVSWDNIKDDVEWFTDNDRKVYSGWLLGQEESENSDIVKFAKRRQTIRKERKILGIERSINNEEIRDISLHQTFTQQVLDAINTRYNDFTIKVDDGLFYNASQMHHIFTLGDFHYDGDISYLDVLKRATAEIKRVIDEKGLLRIYLMEFGDVIEGASLRTSQLMAVKSGMVNQLVDVADAYIKMIEYLSKFVTITFLSVDSSNHTQLRNLGTKQNQLVEEDLMIVFNTIIRKALPNLHMVTGDDIFINIGGFNMFMAHGHLVKSKEKYLETLQANRNILIDYGFFGHFHHQRTIDLHSAGYYDKKVFYVPALNTKESGYENDKNLSSQAGVGYYVFSEEFGHVETRKLVV